MEDTKNAPAEVAANRAVVLAQPHQIEEGSTTRGHTDVAGVLVAEGRRSSRRRIVRVIAGVIAVAAIVAGAGWAWLSWHAAATPAYLTDPAVRGDLVVTLAATGNLQPTQEVAVSSLIAGTILSVDVDYNQAVTKGQPLAHLNADDYDARRKRAAAGVEAQAAARDAAAATVTDASAAFERAEKLNADNVVSMREAELALSALTRAKANLAAAEAQLKAAEADLTSAESDYAKTTLVSPIDGVVLDVNAEAGQTVGSASLATALFVLATDLKRLDLELDIDEADVPHVAVGDQARFTVEAAPDRPLQGVIRQIRSAPTVSDGVTSYKAIVAVDNSAGTLKPGMTATADIQTDSILDVLTVSNAALRFAPKTLPVRPSNQAGVYVLNADGSLRAVPVTVGITDGQRTAIVSGELAVGDLVVTGTKGR